MSKSKAAYTAFENCMDHTWYVVKGTHCSDPQVMLAIPVKTAKQALKRFFEKQKEQTHE